MKTGTINPNTKVAMTHKTVMLHNLKSTLKRTAAKQPGKTLPKKQSTTLSGESRAVRTINYGSSSTYNVNSKQSLAPDVGCNDTVGDDMNAMLLEDAPFLQLLGEGSANMIPTPNATQHVAMLVQTEPQSESSVPTGSTYGHIHADVLQNSIQQEELNAMQMVHPSLEETERNRDIPAAVESNDVVMVGEFDQPIGNQEEIPEQEGVEYDFDMDMHDADDVVDEDKDDEETQRTVGNRSVAQGNVLDGVVVKKQVKVRGGRIAPNKAVRDLGIAIRTNWPGPYTTWAEVPEDPLQDAIWDAFVALWSVPEDTVAIVRKAFNVSARDLYKTSLHRARKAAMASRNTQNLAETVGHGPDWISPPDWCSLLRQWGGTKWQSQSSKNKKNRMTMKDGCVPRHTGGSISFVEHGERMTMQLGRVPTFREVYVHCHSRKKGVAPGQEAVFVDSRAKVVAENYDHLMTAKYGPTWATEVMFDVEMWKKAVGGCKKGRLYGVGNINDIDSGAWRTTADDRLYTRTEVKAMIDEKVKEVVSTVDERVAAVIEGERNRLLEDVAAAVKRTLGVHIADALLSNDTAGTNGA